MERNKLINKLRELMKPRLMNHDEIAVNQAEFAIIMQTFNISWDEYQKPSNIIYYEMEKTEDDLREEFQRMLDCLRIAKEKGEMAIKNGLQSYERYWRLMIEGFIRGVRFFNLELSNEFSRMVAKV